VSALSEVVEPELVAWKPLVALGTEQARQCGPGERQDHDEDVGAKKSP